ncbi:MAG TPA: YtxH domain-containing protein [Anaerolineales bacterium]
MRQIFGFMMGIMVGALFGSTVTLLLAPQSGEKLRNQLRARGEILVADVRHAAEARRIELTNRLESLREAGTPETLA